jgi:hypothetical protein
VNAGIVCSPPHIFDLLAAAGTGAPLRRRLDPEPSNPPPTRAAEARWMATEGTR